MPGSPPVADMSEGDGSAKLMFGECDCASCALMPGEGDMKL
jgi:hypothetical protein